MYIAQNPRFIFSIFCISLAFAFALLAISANAQDDPSAEPPPADTIDTPSEEQLAAQDAQAQELADLDQNITPEDLGVGDPNILPGSPFYGFKNFSRGMQSFFTFNPVKKAELKIKFSNEKLIEADKLEEQGVDDATLKNALDNYGQEVARLKTQAEKLRGAADEAKIELLVRKTADSQIKQYKLLGKIMKNREDIAPEIEQEKADAMKRLSESMADIADPEVLRQKFEEVIKEQKGSSFRHFKNIEVLREVKDNVPDAAKDAIQSAIEQSSKFFEEDFSNIEKGQRDLFNKYIEKTGGNEIRHLEAFDSLNSFTDIDKDMFREMEKAREKTRKRVEERLQGIKDETRKKIFFAHLEDGNMENARIVNELENNLAPETITNILGIKNKMQEKMREKFENAESIGDLDNFFDEIENHSDVQMLSVMDEMERIIPEDKKDFWQKMKKKAMTEMQSNIDGAKRFGRLEDETRMLAGFEPEDMRILDKFESEFGPEFDFFKGMREEQANRIGERFQNFQKFSQERPENSDFLERAEKFRIRIQEDPRSFQQIQKFAPRISEHFKALDTQISEHGFGGEDINLKIERADAMIQKLSSLIENAEVSAPGLEAARSNLTNAREHLEKAKTALSGANKGEAFGLAISAIQNATNGIRMLETSGFEAEQLKYFEHRDQVRMQFKDLPVDQRPDFDQFINVKPPSFENFVRPESFQQDTVCAQVMTPAREKITSQCRVFTNSCLPPGWFRDDSCQSQTAPTGSIQTAPAPIIPATIDYQRLLEEKQRLLLEQSAIQPAPVVTALVTCCVDNTCVRQSETNCKYAGGRVVPGDSCYPDPCGGAATISPEPTYVAPTTEHVACPSYDIIAFNRDCSARGGSVVKKYDQNCGYVPECVVPTYTEPAPTYQAPTYTEPAPTYQYPNY